MLTRWSIIGIVSPGSDRFYAGCTGGSEFWAATCRLFRCGKQPGCMVGCPTRWGSGRGRGISVPGEAISAPEVSTSNERFNEREDETMRKTIAVIAAGMLAAAA